MTVLERAHTFGESGNLTGIVTLPPGDDGSPDSAAASRPFVVILNAGLVHRVGPFRMSVGLARRLAVSGSRVLRFDTSGIGDSPSRGAAAPIEERAVTEAREAMSFLAERYGARSFAVGGLCTGAMNAHRIGLVEPRVVALFLLDGYAYPTWSSRGRRVVKVLRDPASWPNIARHLLDNGKSRIAHATGLRRKTASLTQTDARDSRTELFYQDWPPVPEVRADLERMLRRGARLLFLYTGGWCSFVHERQFDEMFPGLPRRELVTVDFHPDADHTFFAVRDREAMFRSVERFLASTVTA